MLVLHTDASVSAMVGSRFGTGAICSLVPPVLDDGTSSSELVSAVVDTGNTVGAVVGTPVGISAGTVVLAPVVSFLTSSPFPLILASF